jgi:hypothetical protein
MRLLDIVECFACHIRYIFSAELALDPAGFNKSVVSLFRSEFPSHPGRPREEAISRADYLHKQGRPWPEVYTGLGIVDPIAKENLRAAIRARRNRKHPQKTSRPAELIG